MSGSNKSKKSGPEKGHDVHGGSHNDHLKDTSAHDRFDGGEGNDEMEGGRGHDHFNGGHGHDTVDYGHSHCGVEVDLGNGKGKGGDADGDQYTSIEEVKGSEHDDHVKGGKGNDEVHAHKGDDRVFGGQGSDKLFGDAGRDEMNGGDGDDDVNGGDGNDKLDGGTGDDVVNGDEGNDLLSGGTGKDTVSGGVGDDLVAGGKGADKLNGNSGFDTADYRQSSGAVDVNFETGINHGGDAEGDVLTGFEQVLGSMLDDTLTGGKADDRLNGQAGNDVIIGNAGKDQLFGEAGNDQINGGEGDDYISDGAGDDVVDGGVGSETILAGAGADVYNGGEGTDLVSYAKSDAGVSVDLASGSGSGGFAEGDTLKSIEQLYGSQFGDGLAGDALNNKLYGLGGDDKLFGGAGADFLVGGAGNDYVDGGEGIDTIQFSGTWADYKISENGDGSVTVADLRKGAADGTDMVVGVEKFVFNGSVMDAGSLQQVAPTGITVFGDQVVENSAAGTVVATLGTIDGNAGDAFKYEIVGGSNQFAISGNQIVVKAGAAIDFESAQAFGLQIRSTDLGGNSVLQDIKVGVTDVNEAPIAMSYSGVLSLAENVKAGTVVGTVAAKDQDAGDHVSFSISGANAKLFRMDGDKIVVAGGVAFDALKTSSYDIVVKATDDHGLSSSQTVKIGITNVSGHVSGGGGNDDVHGHCGNDDNMDGGNGNDHMHGGHDGDHMHGGHGRDSFSWSHKTVGNHHGGHADHISDFGKDDHLDLRDLFKDHKESGYHKACGLEFRDQKDGTHVWLDEGHGHKSELAVLDHCHGLTFQHMLHDGLLLI